MQKLRKSKHLHTMSQSDNYYLFYDTSLLKIYIDIQKAQSDYYTVKVKGKANEMFLLTVFDIYYWDLTFINWLTIWTGTSGCW